MASNGNAVTDEVSAECKYVDRAREVLKGNALIPVPVDLNNPGLSNLLVSGRVASLKTRAYLTGLPSVDLDKGDCSSNAVLE
mmetsp:Transcript_524/g.1418  ORF Transcript_524/g.1418 Transcript_524/m.1418 type:complete len:82 (+) Transcript_524:431-676(+)